MNRNAVLKAAQTLATELSIREEIISRMVQGFIGADTFQKQYENLVSRRGAGEAELLGKTDLDLGLMATGSLVRNAVAIGDLLISHMDQSIVGEELDPETPEGIALFINQAPRGYEIREVIVTEDTLKKAFPATRMADFKQRIGVWAALNNLEYTLEEVPTGDMSIEVQLRIRRKI